MRPAFERGRACGLERHLARGGIKTLEERYRNDNQGQLVGVKRINRGELCLLIFQNSTWSVSICYPRAPLTLRALPSLTWVVPFIIMDMTNGWLRCRESRMTRTKVQIVKRLTKSRYIMGWILHNEKW